MRFCSCCQIRKQLIQMMLTFPPMTSEDDELLKESGIGRVCNTLAQHPEETQENKTALHTLIGRWSRAVFGQADSYKKVKEDGILS